MQDNTKKIAYIVSRFPSLWETFILGEMVALEKKGYNIRIFSLKNAKWKVRHAAAESFLNRTQYSPFLLSWQIIRSQYYYLTRKPTAYLNILLYVISGALTDFATLLKSLFIFPKSVRFARQVEELNIRHIHAHWATIPCLSAIIISRLTGVPFSVTAHAIDIFRNTTMLEEKLSRAKFIVTCTKNNKRHLTEKYKKLDPKKIFVNYHGIDLSTFCPKKRLQGKLNHILAVGRLEDSKGYPTLLKACRILKDYRIDFHLTIIGDGPDRRQIKKLIHNLRMEQMVLLAGALPQEEVIKYYENSDIFVLPAVSRSHWGIPNVVIEAMAMELPVITTALPAMKELITDGWNGIIVPENDPKALSDAILKIFQSKNLQRALVRNGLQRVQTMFDQEKTIQELIEIYRHWN